MPALPPISTVLLCPAAPALLRARSIEIILSSVASAGCLLELVGLLAGLAHMPNEGRCLWARICTVMHNLPWLSHRAYVAGAIAAAPIRIGK